MAAFRNLIVKVGADTSNAERNLKKLTRPFNSISRAAQDVGKSLTVGLTVPIAALAVAAGKMAIDFEQGMNRVAAVTGATGTEFQRLEDLAKQLGSTTKFSATEAADAMGFLGQAGFDTAQILEAVPATLNLAAAGALELGTAADIASNVLQGFGLNASEAARVADVLAAAAATTNTNVEQLGEAMSFVAPVAKSLGVSMEETAAAIGVLSDAGIQGARAGTNLRAVLSKLISPTKEAATLMKSLGISVTDLEGNLKPLPDVVEALGAASLNTNQKITLFGEKMQAAASVIIERGAPALKQLVTNFDNAGGSAEKMAEIMNRGAAGGIKNLMSALEGLAIAVLDAGILDFFDKMVRGLADMVRSISSASPAMLNLGATIAGLAAAIGPALLAFSALKPAIVTIGTLIAGLNVPIAIGVAALATLGVAAVKAGDTLSNALAGAALQADISDLKREIEDLETVLGLAGKTIEKQANETLVEYRDRLLEVADAGTLVGSSITKAFEVKDVISFQQRIQKLSPGMQTLLADTIRLRDEFKSTFAGPVPKQIDDLITKIQNTGTVFVKGAENIEEFKKQILATSRGLPTLIDLADSVTTSAKKLGAAFEEAVEKQVEALRKQAAATLVAEEAARRYRKEIGELGPAVFDMATDMATAGQSAKELAKQQENLLRKTEDTIKSAQTAGGVWRGYGTNLTIASGETLKLVGALKDLNAPLTEADLTAARLSETMDFFGITAERLADEQLRRMGENLQLLKLEFAGNTEALRLLDEMTKRYQDTLKKKNGAIKATEDFEIVIKAVDNAITSFASGVADAIFGAKSLTEAFVDSMTTLAKTLITEVVKGALGAMRDAIIENEDAVKKLIETFKKLFGIGGPDSVIGGTGGGEGGPPLKDLLGDTANLILKIVDVLLSLIQAFQLARIEGTLNAIEENTRRATLFLGDRSDQGILGQLFKANQHLLVISSDQLTWMLGNQAKMIGLLEQIRDKIGGGQPQLPGTSFSGIELLLQQIRDKVQTVIDNTQFTVERLDQAFVYNRDIRAPQLERIAGHLSDIEDLMRLLVSKSGGGPTVVAIGGKSLAEAEFQTFTEGGLIP